MASTTNYMNTGIQVDNTSSQQYDYRPSGGHQMIQRWRNEKHARQVGENQLTLQNLEISKAKQQQAEWESEAPLRQMQRELKLQQTSYQKDLEQRKNKFDVKMADLRSSDNYIKLTQDLELGSLEFNEQMKNVEAEQLRLDSMISGTEMFHQAAKEYRKNPNAKTRAKAMDELNQTRQFYARMGLEEEAAEITDDLEVEVDEVLALYPTVREQGLGIKKTIQAARTAQAEHAKLKAEHEMQMELERLKAELDPGNRVKSFEELAAGLLAKKPGERTLQEDQIIYTVMMQNVMKNLGETFFNAYWQPGSKELIHQTMIDEYIAGQRRLGNMDAKPEDIPLPNPMQAMMWMSGVLVDTWAAENLERDPYPEDDEEPATQGEAGAQQQGMPQQQRQGMTGAPQPAQQQQPQGPQANLGQQGSVLQNGQATRGQAAIPRPTPAHTQAGFAVSPSGKWTYGGVELVEGQIYNMQGIGRIRYVGPDPLNANSYQPAN